jgi:hypothetical protein
LHTDRARCAALFAIVCSAACVDQSPTQVSANVVIVHAVLDVSARDQFVFVQTTTGAINQQKAVAGATVIVTTPDGRALAAEEIRDPSLYLISSGEPPVTSAYRISLDRYNTTLVAGGTYRLHVALPDGREASASTTIPNVTRPLPVPITQTIDRLRDTLSLAWPSAVGVRVYEVFIQSPRSTFSAFSDTSIVLPGTTHNASGGVAFWPGQTHQVVVNAVDDNYYDYYRRSSDPFTGSGIISHLQGAIGLFGSMVPVVTRTVVVH